MTRLGELVLFIYFVIQQGYNSCYNPLISINLEMRGFCEMSQCLSFFYKYIWQNMNFISLFNFSSYNSSISYLLWPLQVAIYTNHV